MQLRHWSALILLIGSVQALAQVQVREAGTSRNAGAQTPVQQQQPANNDLLVSMYNQLEALQQEVQTLRGVVEEQGYQLKRLQNEQKDRYLDIDRRLSSMNPSPASNQPVTGLKSPAPALPSLDASSAATNSVTTVSTLPAPPPVATAGKKAAVADNGMDEQELYRTALNLLLQENKAEASVPLFQNYIDTYPNGRLYTNALYWQGEAFLATAAPAKAKDVFLRLLAEYPADPKSAGAMLKLGKAYKDLGDSAKAAATWKELRVKYPENANEIRLSEESLKALK